MPTGQKSAQTYESIQYQIRLIQTATNKFIVHHASSIQSRYFFLTITNVPSYFTLETYNHINGGPTPLCYIACNFEKFDRNKSNISRLRAYRIVNSRICPAPGQTRRAFSIREMPRLRDAHDPSGNLRPEKTAEFGGRRRASGSFSKAATYEWMGSYARYRCGVRGILLRREPKHVNPLTLP